MRNSATESMNIFASDLERNLIKYWKTEDISRSELFSFEHDFKTSYLKKRYPNMQQIGALMTDDEFQGLFNIYFTRVGRLRKNVDK